MRHIKIRDLLQTISATIDGKTELVDLKKAHVTAAKRPLLDLPAHVDANGVRRNRRKGRSTYIEDNGPGKWTLIKHRFTSILGNKCWYTETELVGGPLTIDHYRPRRDYWFLAFDASNYRVACPFANSPKDNPLYGCAGGKGDNFPLLTERNRGRGSKRLRCERPIILDPCSEEDCKLIAFLPDGRPVIHPDYATDPIAINRVEQSKLLLNLDHPDFNSKREQLCNTIAEDIDIYEELPAGSARRSFIENRLAARLAPSAPYSVAATFYLRLHRHLAWVQQILDNTR